MTAGEVREDPGEEAQFRRRLAEGLPRHVPPPRLRAAVVALAAPSPRPAWWAPVLSAVATALVLTLVALPLLPPRVEVDPLRPIVSAVLSAHTRTILWGEPRPEVAAADLPRFMEETGIGLSGFFEGDDELRLINAEPLTVEERRALALTYRDAGGHLVTYLLLAASSVPLPRQGRLKVNGFQPFLIRADGFSLFVWKQKDVACFLVSDLVSEGDLSRFKQVFLKVRLGSAPYPKT